MKTLSRKAKKEYIESSGAKCPFCESDNFDCGRPQIDAGGAGQDIMCKNCGASWTDLYTLTEIINIEFPESGC